MARRARFETAWLGALVMGAAAAVACGGNTVTAPGPCDTYHGGIVAAGDSLPASYILRSYCQGTKPDVPGGNGSVTITHSGFTATIGVVTYSGAYTTSAPDGITVNLTSPAQATFVGTYRLRNDTLAVSGAVANQPLSLIGTRAP
jgi:hypothetical protein